MRRSAVGDCRTSGRLAHGVGTLLVPLSCTTAIRASDHLINAKLHWA